jgi:putative membrane protein
MSDLNDPRVLFAAERTLLAWNRTSISLMAFGFLIERFGLFLEIAGREEIKVFQRHISFIVGIAFIVLASYIAFASILQHRRVLRTLRPIEIPAGYNTRLGMMTNGIVAVLGILLSIYLFRGFL